MTIGPPAERPFKVVENRLARAESGILEKKCIVAIPRSRRAEESIR